MLQPLSACKRLHSPSFFERLILGCEGEGGIEFHLDFLPLSSLKMLLHCLLICMDPGAVPNQRFRKLIEGLKELP